MPTATLKDGFQGVRDRLVTISQAAVSTSVATLDYAVPQLSIYPRIEFLVIRTTRQRISDTRQLFTSQWRMTVYCAQFQQGFDGQAQDDAQFNILPTMLEYFEKHSSMKALATDSSPAYYDPVNSGIAAAAVQIVDKEIRIVIDWNIAFNIGIQRC